MKASLFSFFRTGGALLPWSLTSTRYGPERLNFSGFFLDLYFDFAEEARAVQD